MVLALEEMRNGVITARKLAATEPLVAMMLPLLELELEKMEQLTNKEPTT